MINKSRYWWAVLYPDNLVPNWKENIADLLQLPFCYCVHNKDVDSATDKRKEHIHIIFVFPNTTTYNHAFNTLSVLNAEGKQAFNKIESCVSVRYCYDYLIHNTDTCKKNGKFLYNPAERISGNNFDIGTYEQISLAELKEIKRELTLYCIDWQISNYSDLVSQVMLQFEDKYLDVVISNSAHFERLCKGNFLTRVKENY